MATSEFYCIEEIPIKSPSNRRRQKENEYAVEKKRSQDARLHEIEEQLHMAESRCNTLKGQLDYMKMIYNDSEENLQVRKKPTPRRLYTDFHKIRPMSESKIERAEKESKLGPFGDKTLLSNTSPRIGVCSMVSSSTSITPHRESDIRPLNELRLNETGEQTIHRILTGINESVNRISNLNEHIDNKRYKEYHEKKSRKKLFDTASVKNDGINNIEFVHKENTNNNKHLRPYRTLSDTFVSSAASIYAGTAKIPASSNLTRKPHKPRTARTVDAREFHAVKRKSKQVNKNVEKKPKVIVSELKNSAAKINADDAMSIATGKSRKKRRVKHVSSRSTRGQTSINDRTFVSDQFASWHSDKLIELYHNNAVKSYVDSQSEDESIATSKKPEKIKSMSTRSLRTVSMIKKGCQKMTCPSQPNRIIDIPMIERVPQSAPCSPRMTLQPINEAAKYGFNEQQSCGGEPSSLYQHVEKHYELPTVSSKMKQATKNYMHQFNFRNIPFVPTKSTTPSHNLGLNIQQVLSIIKSRQPVTGISPTLAHNMGLVAQGGGSFVGGANGPISSILSRLGSRHSSVVMRRPVCPLLRQATAVAESELADVPEHPCESEPYDSLVISPRIGTTLPVQSSNIGNDNSDFSQRATSEWDQPTARAYKQQRCTCLPRKATNYNKVLNQYLETNEHNLPCSLQQRNQEQTSVSAAGKEKRVKQFKSAFSMRSADSAQYPPDKAPPGENHTINNSIQQKKSFTNQLAGKVRGLRDVLANLHDDFQRMNDKYDILSDQVKNSKVNDPEAMRQLEAMERELNSKEEEITVVISLYREVLALKEQVRSLKERTSVLSMSMYGGQVAPNSLAYRSRSSNAALHEPTVTLRLTKLLRQIQHFQGMLKQRP